MAFSAADHDLMARALRLAERGLFTTTPNPRVGCLVVKDGRVAGEGWHERAGLAHAEVIALQQAGAAAAGADLYVTLEPCAHHGRTPPCSDAVIRAGVRRVVAAMQDPNPLTAGKGYAALRAAGIVVEEGLLAEEAHALNVGFVARFTRGRPWVRLKVAASLDGKTALLSGESQWITGAEARADAHAWRARSCVVMTGVGTLKDDNPRLSVRAVDTTRQPVKVLVDSQMNAPLDAHLFSEGQTLVFAAIEHAGKSAALRGRNAEVIVLPDAGGKVDLALMMRELARREVNEVLVESGSKLNGSLLRAGVVDELLVYLAPSVLGDQARGMFNLPALSALSEHIALDLRDVQKIGADLRIVARVRH
jgi:diaminohydroxyphosphoribosylaminopyrimidine deaminase / 5-amino-6-(5-phosphoribosylamino)uracil reductase